MMLKVRKAGGEASIALPPEFSERVRDGSEVEFFHVRDGIYLIATQGEKEKGFGLDAKPQMQQAGAAAQGQQARQPMQGAKIAARAPTVSATPSQPPLSLSSDETQVARKLTSIRFENRQVPQVEKNLNASEKKAVASLIAKKLVGIMKSAKYPKGVFNISDRLYAAARGDMNAPTKVPSPPINTVEHLRTLGYMVLDNENEAKNLMPTLQDDIKRDDVKGVRGFDRKYYVLLRSFYLEHEGRLLALLDSGKAMAEELAPQLHLTPEAVRTLLMVLSDGGEVIEKQKGVWERA